MFSKMKAKIGPLIKDRKYVVDSKGMTEMLSNQYASVYNTPRPSTETQVLPSDSQNTDTLSDI